MALPSLKVSRDEPETEGVAGFETNGKTVSPDEPADPRPLPVTHGRHLDVNKVLERSLPRLSDES